MPHWPRHGRIEGADRDDRLRIDRQGDAAADRASFRLSTRSRFVVIDPDDSDRKLLDERGISSCISAITRDNYREVLGKYLTAGEGQGFCVNLSVDTSSLDIMRFCREIGALYIDTVVEPWPGFYFDKSLGNEARTNYALRETVHGRAPRQSGRNDRHLLLRRQSRHGLLARQAGARQSRRRPRRQNARAEVARRMGPPRAAPRRQGRAYRRARHAARQDTRSRATSSSTPGRSRASSPKACSRPSSAGARTRSGRRPTRASTRAAAARRSISTSRAPTRASAPGRRPRRRSSASSSPITSRSRSPTITRCATRGARRSTGRPATTPITPATTRCCACTNCSAAPARSRAEHHILGEAEILDGIDELGVLLYGHARNAYWYGSQLSVEETRALAPYQNATGMQVTSAVLAGMVWALENPNAGIVEADEIGLPPLPRSPDALSRPGDRRLYRLDAARRVARACSPRTSTRAIPGSSATCWCDRRAWGPQRLFSAAGGWTSWRSKGDATYVELSAAIAACPPS